MCFASKPRIQNAPPVFGVPLTDSSRSAEYQYVPKIVVKCVEFIERKENITTPGLYRVNVNDFILSEVRNKVRFTWMWILFDIWLSRVSNKVETKADYRPLQRGKLKSVHVVTGVFMLFFREMTTNLITTDVLDYLALELGASIRSPHQLQIDKLKSIGRFHTSQQHSENS